MIRVTVGIATYRRPESLLTLIGDLLEFYAEAPFALRIVVVDNDPDGSGLRALKSIDPPPAIELTGVPELRPGVAAVRNRLIKEAGGDLLAMLDDDERPCPGWLEAFMHYRERTPNVVCMAGPVLTKWPSESPLSRLDFNRLIGRPRYKTGTLVESAGTGNLVLETGHLPAGARQFDLAFSTTGGEDLDFCLRLTDSGVAIHWVDEAEVSELAEDSRGTLSWVFVRGMRVGSVSCCIELRRDSRPSRRVAFFFGGVARIGAGILELLFGLLWQPHGWHHARGLWRIGRGLGFLCGAGGWLVEEYGRRGFRLVRHAGLESTDG